MKRVESPSSILTFKQCQRKYYYQYVQKLPTLPNVHQVRGTIAHGTLEDFYEMDTSSLSRENYTMKCRAHIQGLFFRSWQKSRKQLQSLGLSGDRERFYFEETMLMLMNWTNHFLNDMQEVLGRNGFSAPEAFRLLTPQREQHLKSDHYCVQGYIDAIHEMEEGVHIIDYKTNSSFEFKDELKLQLAIYSLLYFEKNGKMPSKVGIFFLRHKLKLLDADEELLELAKREIGLVHGHTSRTESIDDYPRCTGPLCKWSSGQCDFFGVCKPFENGNP